MGRVRVWAATAVLAVWQSHAGAAELEWRAPEVCPDAAELRFRVERALGMPLSHAAPLRFAVDAAASAQGFTARVGVDPGSGEAPRQRELGAKDCSTLADLVAVTVALALGAGDGTIGDGTAPNGAAKNGTPPNHTAQRARAEGPESGAAPALETTATSARIAADADVATGAAAREADVAPGADASTDAASPSGAASEHWAPGLSLWLLGDTGSLPRAGAGVSVGVHVERAHLELRALGTLLFDQHQTLVGLAEPEPGANLGLLIGALSACAAPFGAFSEPLVVYGCAGWELGRLAGQGTRVLRPRAGSSLWSAPRADLGASWALGASGLRVVAQLTLAVPLAREDFVLGSLGSVHRPPSAVGRAAVGINWVLW